MKTYQANSELEQILLTKGFIETTSQRDKLKGKKALSCQQTQKKKFTSITLILH
jgi:hypothetical protein